MNALECSDFLKDIKSAGDGLLNVAEDRLGDLVRKESIYDVYFVEQTPFARGKFATVRKARHLTTGISYAVKFIRKRRRNTDTTREIFHEIAILIQCASSPKVVNLHEVYVDKNEVALVLELAAGGELQRVLDTEECLNEAEAKSAMRQILDGLTFLHERNIAHLDLKPQNLLVASEGWGADSQVKLCDFGISRVIEPGVEVREILGTPDYVAPEILSYDPISLSTDIWSVGVLAYVLLTGYSPFGADTKQETYLNISQCSLTFPSELFKDVSNVARDFIKSALILDPRKRPSAKKLLDHPWLSAKSPLLPQLSILSPSCDTTDSPLKSKLQLNGATLRLSASCGQCGATCCCHLHLGRPQPQSGILC